MPAIRLQKILSTAGVASRRKAEELISAGRVSLNGKIVTALGTKADPLLDEVRLDGQPLAPPTRRLYLLLHKPKGYVTTLHDPEGRPTVIDLLGKLPVRVFPVGRLDYASEGLLLLTNDGDLAMKLTQASFHVPKKYYVKISGQPSALAMKKLQSGISIRLDDGRRVKTAPAEIRLLRDARNPWYEVTLIEGRNRQIRRMFQQIGFLVEKIKRVQMGPLVLDVPPGRFRSLTEREVQQLRALCARAERP